jgi:hypothetical protein
MIVCESNGLSNITIQPNMRLCIEPLPQVCIAANRHLIRVEVKMFLKAAAVALYGCLSFLVLHAQALPAASRLASVQVGIAGSIVAPDYRQGHDLGFTIYGDLDVLQHFGLEALFRDASIITPRDIGINNYLIGPRIKLTRGRFTPYGKFLLGYGVINFQKGDNPVAYSEHHRMYAYGGGVDMRATRRINVRLFDIEYQNWPGFSNSGLTPYSASAGVAYRF